MHELALMGDIIGLVQEDAAANGINRIRKIELVVGEIANAMPDALTMAFDIFRDQYPYLFAETAEIVIHIEEAKAQCVICGQEYRPEQKIALCPSCLTPSGKMLSGETFQVLSYEGVETDEGNA